MASLKPWREGKHIEIDNLFPDSKYQRMLNCNCRLCYLYLNPDINLLDTIHRESVPYIYGKGWPVVCRDDEYHHSKTYKSYYMDDVDEYGNSKY